MVCRQSCIYGTRQFGVEDQGWIAWFLIAALTESPVVLYGDGKQVRDVLWMDDLIDLFMLMHKSSDATSGKTFNVGGGPDNTLSLNELVKRTPELTGKSLSMSQADWRPGDQKVYVSDISKSAASSAGSQKSGLMKA